MSGFVTRRDATFFGKVIMLTDAQPAAHLAGNPYFDLNHSPLLQLTALLQRLPHPLEHGTLTPEQRLQVEAALYYADAACCIIGCGLRDLPAPPTPAFRQLVKHLAAELRLLRKVENDLRAVLAAA